MARIIVTAQLPNPAGQLLTEKGHELIMTEGNRSKLLKHLPTADGLLCLLSDSIDKELLDCALNLKCISVYAVGYNNVDLTTASQKNIAVTNTPDVLTEASADLTLLLILAVTRRIREGMEMMEKNSFPGWGPDVLVGRQLSHMTVGILGAGRIGGAVIRKLHAFGCKIIYNRTSGENPALAKLATHVSQEKLISSSDLISIHTPLTPETLHLFDYQTMQKMKKNAYLVNTSRGPVIHEESLVRLLREEHLAGAALDVFEFEPKVTEALTTMKNVILTPHVGSATLETRQAMSRVAAENLLDILENRVCPNQVN